MQDEDHFLRDRLAEALRELMDAEDTCNGYAKSGEPEKAQEWADKLLIKLGEAGTQEWAVTQQKGSIFEAATQDGTVSTQIIGCMHLWQGMNGSLAGAPAEEKRPEEIEYLHLCGLDAHITLMLALRELYRRHRAGETLPHCDHEFRRLYGHEKPGDWCQACGDVVAS